MFDFNLIEEGKAIDIGKAVWWIYRAVNNVYKATLFGV